jgi:selenocysteine lyase/cysteine desulfurase
LELLLELGAARIEPHVQALVDRLIEWGRSRRDVECLTPADAERRAGIAAFVVPELAATSKRLREGGVVHSVREGAIRLAPHFHNNSEDIDRAIRLLEASSQ